MAKNVFSIADNPKFKRAQKFNTVAVTPAIAMAKKVFTLDVTRNQFGFQTGDLLICREDFDASKITQSTLVITNIDGRRELTCKAENPADIEAVVIAVQREVENA